MNYLDTTTEKTKALHELYCSLTGLSIKYTTYHHYAWERWVMNDHTPRDLEITIKYVNGLIRQGQRKIETFKFRYFIEDLPKFADDLAMARGVERFVKQNVGKADVLKATGRHPDLNRVVAVTPEQVLKQVEALDKFRQWRKDTGL